jgi:hypothetical protein
LIVPAAGGRAAVARERELIAMPRFADLPEPARATLWMAETVAGHLRLRSGLGLDCSLLPPERALADVHHHLSPLFPCPKAPISLAAARHESAVLTASTPMLELALRDEDPAALINAIKRISGAFTGIGDLRNRPRCASPDRSGRYVIYAAPERIADQLAAIARALRSKEHRPRAFDAMLAFVAITNCHPLMDGNGRLSRVVGNWLLGGTSLYLPLREIAVYARGGYLLRVREAEINGNWEPLARFLLAALRLWAGFLAIGES